MRAAVLLVREETCYEGNDERVTGVLIQRYWLARHGMCIGNQQAKATKDNKDSENGKNEWKKNKDPQGHIAPQGSGQEKKKDFKEKERGAPNLPATLSAMAQQLGDLATRLTVDQPDQGEGSAFIAAAQRPVGDRLRRRTPPLGRDGRSPPAPGLVGEEAACCWC